MLLLGKWIIIINIIIIIYFKITQTSLTIYIIFIFGISFKRIMEKYGIFNQNFGIHFIKLFHFLYYLYFNDFSQFLFEMVGFFFNILFAFLQGFHDLFNLFPFNIFLLILWYVTIIIILLFIFSIIDLVFS